MTQKGNAGQACVAGADGKCSPEPGKAQTDVEARRSGSPQAQDPPGRGGRSRTGPGARGKLRIPSPAAFSGPSATETAPPRVVPGELSRRYRRTRRLEPEDGADAQSRADAA